MKIYAEVPNDAMSHGIKRVRDALKRHAPSGVVFVGDRAEADLIVHHVVGVQNFDSIPLHERIESDGKPYAMLQYCLKTTENGGAAEYWLPLWHGAKSVWSYYDLDAHLGEPFKCPNFYYAPLGVDDAFRRDVVTPKLFTIGTCGRMAADECIDAAAAAVAATDGYHYHLGPDLGLGPRTVTQQYVLPDEIVARMWAECLYVGGLRRCEGFELPAAEALCVGSRPILFDYNYRWFGETALYIVEENGFIQEQLAHIFKSPYVPVTKAERQWARETFNWATLVPEFWKRVL